MVAMQFGQPGQVFLRQAAHLPQRPNGFSQRNKVLIDNGHVPCRRRPVVKSPHRISVIDAYTMDFLDNRTYRFHHYDGLGDCGRAWRVARERSPLKILSSRQRLNIQNRIEND